MGILLCPSMMCADAGNLRQEVKLLEEAGCDMFHVDIMDGNFVPNFAMGLQDAACITGATSRPVDVHLMIEKPVQYVETFAAAGADILYIHPEADVHAPRTLQKITDLGMSPGIALNPGTSVEAAEFILPLCRYVLVMTVNPGFAGQKYLPFIDKKIQRLIALKQEYDYKIIIDGACSPDIIRQWSRKGADGFVLGTSALFGKNRPYGDIMAELRQLTEDSDGKPDRDL